MGRAGKMRKPANANANANAASSGNAAVVTKAAKGGKAKAVRMERRREQLVEALRAEARGRAGVVAARKPLEFTPPTNTTTTERTTSKQPTTKHDLVAEVKLMKRVVRDPAFRLDAVRAVSEHVKQSLKRMREEPARERDRDQQGNDAEVEHASVKRIRHA